MAEESDKWSPLELLELSRLWKFEGNETFDDAKEMLSNSDMKSFPMDI
jgi:hypothetical protein